MAQKTADFIKTWLQGTTCHRHKRTVEWFSDTLVFVKHHGHSEYCGRWSGVLWCPTYYALYDRTVEYDGYGDKALKKWEGRWTKAKQKELEEAVASHKETTSE